MILNNKIRVFMVVFLLVFPSSAMPKRRKVENFSRNCSGNPTNVANYSATSDNHDSAAATTCIGCPLHCACAANASPPAGRELRSKGDGKWERIAGERKDKLQQERAVSNATIAKLTDENERMARKIATLQSNARRSAASNSNSPPENKTTKPLASIGEASEQEGSLEKEYAARTLRRHCHELEQVLKEKRHDVLVQTLCRPGFYEVLEEVSRHNGLRHAIANDYKNAVEDWWTPERGLRIRNRCGLSRREYQTLIYALSSNYKEAIDDYEVELFEGAITFPRLSTHASTRATDALKRKLHTVFEPQESEDKKTVSLSVPIYLKEVLNTPQYQAVISPTTKQRSTKLLGLQTAGDGAALDARGKIGQVTFSWKASPMVGERMGNEGSRKACYTAVIFEGAETYEEMVEPTSRLVKEMSEVKQEGGLYISSSQSSFVGIQLLGGGDMKFISAATAHCGGVYLPASGGVTEWKVSTWR